MHGVLFIEAAAKSGIARSVRIVIEIGVAIAVPARQNS